MILLKTSKQIDHLRKSCGVVGYVLSKIEKEIKPGITTSYLDNLAEELCLEQGCIPGFKGYKGFPFTICASKNNEIVHGFPDDIPLETGDILSVDFGAIYKGWYGDSAITIPVGTVNKKIKKLLKIGQECLDIAINKATPYCRVGDIGASIQQHAEKNRFGVVREFVGHGIGKNLHEDPSIPNFGEPHTGYILKPGTTIAIEPMIVVGNYKTKTLSNSWTVVTVDGSLSVHFEHTILITENGPEILTKRN